MTSSAVTWRRCPKKTEKKAARQAGQCQSKGKCVATVHRGGQHHNDRSRGDQQKRQEGEQVTSSHGSSPDRGKLVYSLCKQPEHGLRVKPQPEQQSHHYAEQ